MFSKKDYGSVMNLNFRNPDNEPEQSKRKLHLLKKRQLKSVVRLSTISIDGGLNKHPLILPK